MGKTMKATIELGGKLDGSLLKTMSAAEKQMAALRRSAGTIHKAAGVAARAVGVAAVAAGAATVKVVKDSLEAGKNFDASMAQVAATMGKSVDEIGDLRQFALDMGKTTMFSASQSAEALNYMALAGYDAETSMKMLPNVLNLAAAGGMELADASDMVTDASSALGLSLDETSQLVDQMAAASSHSNTSVAQLGEALLTVGGTAKGMKGGTVEAAQALGLLADNGVKGAEGGTALRNILLGLSDKKFADTFGELGVSAYDAQGNMRSLEDVFLDMNAAMADMTVEEKTKLLSAAFNKVDLKSLNALLGTSKDRWEELAASIDDSAGAAQKMAATQMDNLAGDVTYFQSALEGAQIALSDALTPALREFVQYGTEELGNVTEILESESFKEFADSIAHDIIDALKAGIEAVEQFQEGFAEGFDAEGFMSAISAAGQAISNAFGDGSDAPAAKNFGSMLAGALNTAATAIEAATPLIGGVAEALSFLFDNADVVLPVIVGIAGAFTVINAVRGIAGVISTIGTALGIVGGAGAAAGAGLTATAGGVAAGGTAATAAAPPLLELGGAILMIGGGVALAALGVGLLAQSAIALSQAEGAPLVLLGIGVGIGALMVAAAALGPALTAASVGILAFGGAVALIGVGVAAACVGISLVIDTLANSSAGISEIIAAIGDAFNGAVATIGNAISQIVDSVGGLAQAIGGAISGVLDSVAGIFDSIGNAAINAGTGMQSMVDAIGQLAGMDIIAMGASIGTAADGINKLVASASGAAEAASSMEYLNGLVQSVMNRFAELSATSSALQSSASGAAQAYTSVAFAIMGVATNSGSASAGFAAIASGASQASGALSAARGPAMSMVDAIMSLSGTIPGGATAFSAFASAVASAMWDAESSVSSACSSMESSVNGMHLQIPTITVSALPHFSMSGEFNPETKSVPTVSVSYYAAGGFTDGPIAIAGEAGMEAIISFDKKYREENIAYWLMAGQMLGMIQPFAAGGFTDGTASPLSIEIASESGSLASAASGTGAFASGGNTIDFGGVTFAPQVTVAGQDKEDVLEQLKSAEEEFFDMLDEWASEREFDYAPTF